MSSGGMNLSKPTAAQAESSATDQRDAQSPILITQLLFALLGVRGEATHRQSFCMKTRDNIVLGALAKPWRRSTTWLALKVALRVALEAAFVGDEALKVYKNLQIYLHARLAQDLRRGHHVSVQCLNLVGVKLARRMHKLESHVYAPVRRYAVDKLKLLNDHINHVWTDVCADEQSMRIEPVNREDVSKYLSLTESAKSLKDILNRAKIEPDRRLFKPSSTIRGGFNATELPDPHVFREVLSNNSMFLLTDVEDWVAVNLDTWLNQCSGNSDDCNDILALATAYHERARDIYDKHPTLLSVMMLTLFDLWRALDMLATQLTPLLLLYSPELSTAYCEFILIAKSTDLYRLRRLESHIQRREDAPPDNPLPSIFGSLHEKSFEVCYYDQSTTLVQLRQRIEQDACKMREEKIEEHGRELQKYEIRKNQIAAMPHQHPHGRPRPKRCDRCREEIEVEKHFIDVYEWPLPGNELMMKALICELDLDTHIRAWRDLTWLVVHDIGRKVTDDKKRTKERPNSYSLLQRYFEGNAGRVGLVSYTKPLDRAHMKPQKLPVEISRVVVEHGLEWAQGLEDGVWTTSKQDTAYVKALCTIRLPPGDNNLQCWLGGWTHTENEVIAKAHDNRLTSIRSAEYEAVGTLRAGASTTWLRILRHLRDTELDLNAVRCGIFIRQAISQAGPDECSYVLRDCHSWLAERRFCTQLLATLCDIYESIKSNWTELNVLRIVLSLLMRLINFSPFCREQLARKPLAAEAPSRSDYNEELTLRACKLLRLVRHTSMQWSNELLGQTREHCNVNHEDDNQTRPVLLQSALVCKSSFFLESHMLQRFFPAEELAKYIATSVIIHNYCPKVEGPGHEYMPEVLECFRWSIDLAPYVWDLSSQHVQGIGEGINQVWNSLRFDKAWQLVNQTEVYWILCETMDDLQMCHHNLVTGDLRVDGQPLQRLPRDFTSSAVYKRLLGNSLIDVHASNVAGMMFSSTLRIHGHKLHLGKHFNTVIVRASSHASDEYDILPASIWQEDIPKIIVEDSVQWFDLQRHTIEFRPLERKWEESPRNYTIAFDSDNPDKSLMRRGDKQLLDLTCPAQQRYADIFGSFEDKKYIHVTLDGDNQIEIDLPRFGLKFFLNSVGQLQSRDFSEMKLADDQSLSTLIGLESRLVLNSVRDRVGVGDRFVLIPYGEVDIKAKGDHVTIVIESKERHRTCYKYPIAPMLGSLQSPGELQAHIFLAYLHALTAFPRSDPLTSANGMDRSFLLLRQSRTRTTGPMNTTSISILGKISQISPVHDYDSTQSTEIPTVKWQDSFPSWSQRSTYALLVHDITKANRKTAFLFEVEMENRPSYNYKGDMALLSRAATMTDSCYSSNAIDSQVDRRVPEYDGRDQPGKAQDPTFIISDLISQWPSKHELTRTLWHRLTALGSLGGFGQELEYSTANALLNFDVSRGWGTLLQRCRTASRAKDQYDLAFVFGTIAFGQSSRVPDLQAILAFAFDPTLKSLCDLLPDAQHFDLTQGVKPDTVVLKKCIKDAQKPFDTSVANATKRRTTFDTQSREQTEVLLQHVLLKCPAQQFSLPAQSHISCFDRDRLTQTLKDKWTSWRDNHALKKFADAVEAQTPSIGISKPVSVIPELTTQPADELVRIPYQGPTLVDLLATRDLPRWDRVTYLAEAVHGNIVVRDTVRMGGTSAAPEHGLLQRIIGRAAKRHPDRPQYTDHLYASLDSLTKRTVIQEQALDIAPHAEDSVLQCYHSTTRYLSECLEHFNSAISPQSKSGEGLQLAGLWPCATPYTLLQCLLTDSRARLHPSWEPALISYAVSITETQRCLRYLRYIRGNDQRSLIAERMNIGHQSWEVGTFPEWLLFEIENDLLIRHEQVRVTAAMTTPESGKSSLVQLSMGLGKSAVITPLLACNLANGQQLLCIVVLKSLHPEVLKELSRKLGGLLDKRVIDLVFSRRTAITGANYKRLRKLLQHANERKDVVLTTPESYLALQLSPMDSMARGDFTLGHDMFGFCEWLKQTSRMVIDESDMVLSPIFELVYPLGMSAKMDAAPDRWCIVQRLYDFVQTHAREISMLYPTGLELFPRQKGAFPRLRILQPDAGDALLRSITREALNGSIDGLQPTNSEPCIWQSVTNFVSNIVVSKEDYKAVCLHFEGIPLQKLFILRGQLAYRLLLFPLEGRRHNVNFGLYPTRCRAAVPYRALNTPSPTADFANGDVVVVATAISYYNTDLSEEQLMQCMIQLLKSPNQQETWREWTTAANLPSEYRSVKSLNLQDPKSWQRIHQHLCTCKACG